MKTKVKDKFSTSKGLIRVLCGVLIVISNFNIVNASSTADDLKAYLGITVEKHEEEKESHVDGLENESINYEKNDDEQSSENDGTSKIELAKTELEILNGDLEHLIKKDKSGFEIVSKISEIRDKKREINDLGYNVQGTESTDENIGDEGTIIHVPANDIKSRWYNIGYIGSYLKEVVTPMRIYKPYGYLAEEIDGKLIPIGDKNNALWLKITEGAQINCLFNGIVYSVEAEEDKELYSICISHGQDVYTIYRHVKLSDILHKGDKVSQYQILGEVGKASHDDVTHLELQVVIEGKYENPLNLFGTSGKNLYNQYERSYADRYYVEIGEYAYYEEEMSVENPNR